MKNNNYNKKQVNSFTCSFFHSFVRSFVHVVTVSSQSVSFCECVSERINEMLFKPEFVSFRLSLYGIVNDFVSECRSVGHC